MSKLKKFTNILRNQKISGNMNSYKDFILIDCIVTGDMNTIGGMLRGEIKGNMNTVNYICDTKVKGNMNTIKEHLSIAEYENNDNPSKYDNLPPEIRSAMLIKENAEKAIRRNMEDINDIERQKREHYEKYGTYAQKAASYLSQFYKGLK